MVRLYSISPINDKYLKSCATGSNRLFQAGVPYKTEKPITLDNTEHRIRITLTSQNIYSLEKGIFLFISLIEYDKI